jgi:hypothetical protein
MGELYVYTGSDWKQANQFYIYTGSDWKEANEGYVYTGSDWKQFWPTAFPRLISVNQQIGSDGDGCSPNKCVRCIEWEAENASDGAHHIRLSRSVGGGNFFETFDNVAINRRCNAAPALSNCGDSGCDPGTDFDLKGCFCDLGCQGDGTSTQFNVRLEIDGTDSLAGPLDCDKTTPALSNCGEAS